MKVGIVGSSADKLTVNESGIATFLIRSILLHYCDKEDSDKVTVVSGRSPKKGIDEIAETEALKLGCITEIYPPEVNQWEDKIEKVEQNPGYLETEEIVTWEPRRGYKSRNLQIVNSGLEVLWCFVTHRERLTFESTGRGSGGLWTAKEARKRNVPAVFVVEIGEYPKLELIPPQTGLNPFENYPIGGAGT